jgi:hypothetical protein
MCIPDPISASKETSIAQIFKPNIVKYCVIRDAVDLTPFLECKNGLNHSVGKNIIVES